MLVHPTIYIFFCQNIYMLLRLQRDAYHLYVIRGCVKIDKVAKKARNLANHHKSCKNNRLKINLLDLSRFVGFLRDSALNLF